MKVNVIVHYELGKGKEYDVVERFEIGFFFFSMVMLGVALPTGSAVLETDGYIPSRSSYWKDTA